MKSAEKNELPSPIELIDRLSDDLRARNIDNPVMVGIRTGGLWVAERLHTALKLETPLGSLDITFYRDDFSRVGVNPRVRPSALPVSIEGRHVILVDDVLFSGRTIRAAMNELFDFGRPETITLAVLVDRGGRQLPIAAEFVGVQCAPPEGKQIKLTGPEPLKLVYL